MVTFSGPISVHRKLSQVKFGITIIGTFEAILIFLMCVALSECALQSAILPTLLCIIITTYLFPPQIYPKSHSDHEANHYTMGLSIALRISKIKKSKSPDFAQFRSKPSEAVWDR